MSIIVKTSDDKNMVIPEHLIRYFQTIVNMLADCPDTDGQEIPLDLISSHVLEITLRYLEKYHKDTPAPGEASNLGTRILEKWEQEIIKEIMDSPRNVDADGAPLPAAYFCEVQLAAGSYCKDFFDCLVYYGVSCLQNMNADEFRKHFSIRKDDDPVPEEASERPKQLTN